MLATVSTKNKRKLIYPSQTVVMCFGTIQTQTNECLAQKVHKINLFKDLKNEILSQYSFDLVDCTEHQICGTILPNDYYKVYSIILV